jgi:hypothetical protein
MYFTSENFCFIILIRIFFQIFSIFLDLKKQELRKFLKRFSSLNL